MATETSSNMGHDCTAVEAVMGTFCRLLREHLDACNELEMIADSLPHNIDGQSCILLAERIPQRLQTVHTIENEVIYRLLRSPRSRVPLLFDLDRLQSEHQIDEDYAEEVSDMLVTLASGRQVNMEHAGYLLRGFFQSSRRHVRLDLECIVPRARQLLRPADLDRMRQILSKEQAILPLACVRTRRQIKSHRLRAKH